MYFKNATPAQSANEKAVADKIAIIDTKREELMEQIVSALRAGIPDELSYAEASAELNGLWSERNSLIRELSHLQNQRAVYEKFPSVHSNIIDQH